MDDADFDIDYTDDFHTFNDHGESAAIKPLSVLRDEAKCLCMTHWGEFPLVHCAIDPAVTAQNVAMLKAERR